MNFEISTFRNYKLIRMSEVLSMSSSYRFKEKNGEAVLLAMQRNVDDVSEVVGEIKSKLRLYFYFNFLQDVQE